MGRKVEVECRKFHEQGDAITQISGMDHSSECQPTAELELPHPARKPFGELEHKGSSAASPVQVHQDNMTVVARCTYLTDVMVEQHQIQALDEVTAPVVGHLLNLEHLVGRSMAAVAIPWRLG